jgi:hypothetical protein
MLKWAVPVVKPAGWLRVRVIVCERCATLHKRSKINAPHIPFRCEIVEMQICAY